MPPNLPETDQAEYQTLCEQFENASITYQNMKDRQSFRTLGLLSGMILALIGLILGQSWPVRLALLAAGLAILGLSWFRIKHIPIAELNRQEALVQAFQDQVSLARKKLKEGKGRKQ